LKSGDQPWDVGSGSEELNGTFDMMGNVWEWTECPLIQGEYTHDSERNLRGGSYGYSFGWGDYNIGLLDRYGIFPTEEDIRIGLRVASVPEPCSLVLLSLGGFVLLRRRKK
jgi:hypothetical protein